MSLPSNLSSVPLTPGSLGAGKGFPCPSKEGPTNTVAAVPVSGLTCSFMPALRSSSLPVLPGNRILVFLSVATETSVGGFLGCWTRRTIVVPSILLTVPARFGDSTLTTNPAGFRARSDVTKTVIPGFRSVSLPSSLSTRKSVLLSVRTVISCLPPRRFPVLITRLFPWTLVKWPVSGAGLEPGAGEGRGNLTADDGRCHAQHHTHSQPHRRSHVPSPCDHLPKLLARTQDSFHSRSRSGRSRSCGSTPATATNKGPLYGLITRRRPARRRAMPNPRMIHVPCILRERAAPMGAPSTTPIPRTTVRRTPW